MVLALLLPLLLAFSSFLRLTISFILISTAFSILWTSFVFQVNFLLLTDGTRIENSLNMGEYINSLTSVNFTLKTSF